MALIIQGQKQALDYWPELAGPRPVHRVRPRWLSQDELMARISETLRQQVGKLGVRG